MKHLRGWPRDAMVGTWMVARSCIARLGDLHGLATLGVLWVGRALTRRCCGRVEFGVAVCGVVEGGR